MKPAFLHKFFKTFQHSSGPDEHASLLADTFPPFVRAHDETVGQLIEEYEAHRMSWMVQDWALRCGLSVVRVKGQWFASQDQRYLVAELDQSDADIVLFDAVECTVYYARTRASWELLAMLTQTHPPHGVAGRYREMSRSDAIAMIKLSARSAVTVV